MSTCQQREAILAEVVAWRLTHPAIVTHFRLRPILDPNVFACSPDLVGGLITRIKTIVGPITDSDAIYLIYQALLESEEMNNPHVAASTRLEGCGPSGGGGGSVNTGDSAPSFSWVWMGVVGVLVVAAGFFLFRIGKRRQTKPHFPADDVLQRQAEEAARKGASAPAIGIGVGFTEKDISKPEDISVALARRQSQQAAAVKKAEAESVAAEEMQKVIAEVQRATARVAEKREEEERRLAEWKRTGKSGSANPPKTSAPPPTRGRRVDPPKRLGGREMLGAQAAIAAQTQKPAWNTSRKPVERRPLPRPPTQKAMALPPGIPRWGDPVNTGTISGKQRKPLRYDPTR